MKNLFGEEVKRIPLRFEWGEPFHLWVYRGKNFFCNVELNGWTGKTATIQYELGEPLIENIEEISFQEVSQIIDEFWKHTTRKKCLKAVRASIKKEKHEN